MAAYYTHFHEGQRYWQHWASVRRHSSCPARPISLTTGRNALPQLVHKQAAPNDLCIKHQEWGQFTPQGTDSRQSKFSNVLLENFDCGESVTVVRLWKPTIAGRSVCGYDAQTLCHPSLRYLMRYKSNYLQFTRLTWHQYLDCSYLN